MAIVGAGISGLYSAMMFEHLNKKHGYNISYTIFEGEDRVGGRLWTHRYEEQFKWLYSDMGGMRLPGNHAPVFDMIDFINERIDDKNRMENETFPKLRYMDYFIESRDARFLNQTKANPNCGACGLRNISARFNGISYYQTT